MLPLKLVPPPKLATRAYGTIAGQIKASKQRKTNKKIATFIHMQNPEMDYAILRGSGEGEMVIRPL